MSSIVRTLRRERGLTLEQLGSLTGLTRSYLSKVERELSTPSISAAMKIADALGVDVGRLFAAESERSTLVLDRAPDESGAARPRTALRPLASTMLGKTMSPFVLRPSADRARHQPTHDGQEFLFVHTGSIELSYDGEAHELSAGDSAYFDATRVHRIRSTSTPPATVVIVAASDLR